MVRTMVELIEDLALQYQQDCGILSGIIHFIGIASFLAMTRNQRTTATSSTPTLECSTRNTFALKLATTCFPCCVTSK